MSVADALAFISAVRQDLALAAQLEALEADASLERVAEIATAHGFAVTADDLRSAHQHDWGMRWARFRPA